MSKSILLSIKPEWLVKILNKEKTIEVRKLFPKNYVGWIYMYCSKNDNLCRISKISQDRYICGKDFDTRDFPHLSSGYEGKGKVVARFWCDKVDEWDIWQKDLEEKVKLACLSIKEFDDYSKGQVAYAIHISNLEIFAKPKELGEFKRYMDKWDYYSALGKYDLSQPKEKLVVDIKKEFDASLSLTKAPQNYCYVEGE